MVKMVNYKQFLFLCVCVLVLINYKTGVGCDLISRNKLKRRMPMAVIVQNCDESKIQIVEQDIYRAATKGDEPDDETLRAALRELEDGDDEEFEESNHEPKSIYKIIAAVLRRLHGITRRAVKRARNAEKRESLLREAYTRKA